VQFFKSVDTDLWAFSGIGTVYLNIIPFTQAYVKAKRHAVFAEQPKHALLLAVAAAGFHESAAMAIRKALNNANVSSVDNFARWYPHFYTSDPGTLAQILLFKIGIPRWWLIDSKEARDAMFAFAEQKISEFPSSSESRMVIPVHCPHFYVGISRLPKYRIMCGN